MCQMYLTLVIFYIAHLYTNRTEMYYAIQGNSYFDINEQVLDIL